MTRTPNSPDTFVIDATDDEWVLPLEPLEKRDIGPVAHQGTINLRPLLYELKVMTKERGVKRFGDIINYAQESVIDEVHRQIAEYGQVRIIVLKARQLGISTCIEAIIFSLSILFSDFQSLIISHEAESSEHILGMTNRYWSTYTFRDMHIVKYAGRKQLAWADIGSNITVATAKNTGAGRSKTLHALHASEVAFWDKPDELVTGLRQAIPSFGLTLMFYESTANGIGNFFHQTWVEAEGGRSEFRHLFYPWHLHPEYTSAYIPRSESGKYAMLGDLTEDERRLLTLGVTPDRLLWRRWAIKNLCNGDPDKFKQEYPTTPHEAFLTTGRNVFNLNDLTAHYQPMRPKRGRLIRNGRDIMFVEDHRGPLAVYRYPSKDRNWGIYQIGGDPTHTTVGDKACAQVLSRRTLEQAAVLSAHVDPIEFGRQLYLLGEWYNTATIAPEKEGPGYATVGHLVGANYPMVWESQKIDRTPGKVQLDTFGWGTNKSTKHLAISHLVNAISQPLQRIGQQTYGLLIHDEETFTEMRDYITDEQGGYCNGDGSKFDDCVMALGIALATHYIDPAPAAYTADTHARDIAQVIRQQVTQDAAQDGRPDPNEYDSRPDWMIEDAAV